MTLFEFRICRLGQGILGIINRDEILDMTTRDFYYLWDSKEWAKPYNLETQVGNRIINAIVNSGMIEDKGKSLDGLIIVDPEWANEKINDEYEANKNIKAPEKVEING
jgi:hypothetical protein